ncbi:MAG: UDP-N-acetylglucosamine 1-carboxyvinyltransferase [Patescibacteria group bacterium]
MDRLIIQGQCRLEGEVEVLGVKNGILPMMAAAILGSKGQTVLHNVPDLRDIHVMSRVLEGIGASVEHDLPTSTLMIDCQQICSSQAPYHWVKQMRASFLVMGPLVARTGSASVSLPGGCSIGARKVDMHLEALRKFGATVEQRSGMVVAEAKKLSGTVYCFDFPTHTGTENIMMAACLADGDTTLINAACEPEVRDLGCLLNAMGAKVSGAGTPIIRIEGVDQLHGVEYSALPSRIETGFFMIAAAITGGEIVIGNAITDNLGMVVDKLRQIGVEIRELGGNRALVKRTGRLTPANIVTWPFPGFPTDLQPQTMALLTLAEGVSVVKETVFEKRFMHVDELNRLGARITTRFDEAVIEGVNNLTGAPVMASDLQAGACLVLAGMAAGGETSIDRVYHIDRGYAKIEERLTNIGAAIERVSV